MKFWSTKKEIKRNSPVRWDICSSLMRPTSIRRKHKSIRFEEQVTSILRLHHQQPENLSAIRAILLLHNPT
jgi:hypothetical protein